MSLLSPHHRGRISADGANRRNQRSQERSNQTHCGRGCEGKRIRRSYSGEQTLQESRRDVGERESRQEAGHCQNNALFQHHFENVALAGAKRHADSKFLLSQGDREGEKAVYAQACQ